MTSNGASSTPDVASRAALLKETAEHHDPYEKSHARTTGGTGTPPT
jgi:hypothetical protein